MHKYEVYDVTCCGVTFKMEVVNDPWGIDDLVLAGIVKGTFEEGDALGWWVAMCAAAEKDSVMLDIGAYTGIYSLVAISSKEYLKCAAVEASAVTFSRLVRNAVINEGELRLFPYHAAISGQTGVVQLGHPFGVYAMASGESLIPAYDVDHVELVASVSLDELIFQAEQHFGAIASKQVGLVPIRSLGGAKIDVEGAESDVLSGASRVLEVFAPPLILEILDHDTERRISDQLGELGYLKLAECKNLNFVFCHASSATQLNDAHERVVGQDRATSIQAKLSWSR